jgi:hypothetical protein
MLDHRPPPYDLGPATREQLELLHISYSLDAERAPRAGTMRDIRIARLLLGRTLPGAEEILWLHPGAIWRNHRRAWTCSSAK